MFDIEGPITRSDLEVASDDTPLIRAAQGVKNFGLRAEPEAMLELCSFNGRAHQGFRVLGWIELVEERKRGNCTERIVRDTATHYLDSPEALG